MTEKNGACTPAQALYDGKIFIPKVNSENGEVSDKTVFNYHLRDDGKLELHEEWQWLNGDKSSGTSVLIQK